MTKNMPRITSIGGADLYLSTYCRTYILSTRHWFKPRRRSVRYVCGYVLYNTHTNWLGEKNIYICMIRRLDLQLLSMTSDDEEKEISYVTGSSSKGLFFIFIFLIFFLFLAL